MEEASGWHITLACMSDECFRPFTSIGIVASLGKKTDSGRQVERHVISHITSTQGTTCVSNTKLGARAHSLFDLHFPSRHIGDASRFDSERKSSRVRLSGDHLMRGTRYTHRARNTTRQQHRCGATSQHSIPQYVPSHPMHSTSNAQHRHRTYPF